jgi:CIC family chloride channel protein
MAEPGNAKPAGRRFQYHLRPRIGAWLDRHQPPETALLIGTALLVGLGTGAGAVLFIWLLRRLVQIFTAAGDWLESTVGVVGLVLVPIVGALIAGPLITFFAREAKGHGVPEVMQAIALRGGRIRPVVVVIKALASAACISSGGSAGREGPIVQIGAALGSTIGQLFHLSDERIRNLVACGAASGIAAVFNAPIAGVIFALEVILGEFTTGYFGTVVIAAVTSGIVSRALLGDQPAFHVPAYNLISPLEIALYTILGMITTFGALFFVRSLYWMEDRFDGWRFPEYLKPAIGGLLTGIVGLWFPQVLGTGLDFIGESISVGGTALWLLLALGVFKIVATSFTLGSGNSGGVFAPALFAGAMFGAAFGQMVHSFMPNLTAAPGAYALVGMAALFAAAAHAPITAVLIVFEMSGDYRLILPLMFATVVSTLLSEYLQPESIYTLKLVRRGIRLERGRDIDVMQGVLVGEAMTTGVETISADMELSQLDMVFNESHHHGFPVLDENGELFGIVTLQDVARAKERGLYEGHKVREIATRSVLTAYPDEPMWVALKRLGTRDVGRLPVVDRQNPHHLLGLIRRNDIVRAYRVGINRRLDLQERADKLRLGKLTGTEFIEILVEPGSPQAGKQIHEVPLPEDCLLTTARRGDKVILLHGNTRIRPGDRIVALANPECARTLSDLFRPIMLAHTAMAEASQPPPPDGMGPVDQQA